MGGSPAWTLEKSKICFPLQGLNKNSIFWDVNRHFRGKYRLHLQGRKIRERGTSVIRWLKTEFFIVTAVKTSNLKIPQLSSM
jgi:hypothetical protein